MSRPSEPWASREAGRHTDMAWGQNLIRDYGWPEEVFTTHYHGDDSELPMLAAGATTGNAGSGRRVNREVLRLAVATLLVRRDPNERPA